MANSKFYGTLFHKQNQSTHSALHEQRFYIGMKGRMTFLSPHEILEPVPFQKAFTTHENMISVGMSICVVNFSMRG